MANLDKHAEKLPAQVWKVASVAVLGSLLAQIDSTVVNVSLSSLANDLHCTLATIQWVTSGYLLALALVMPMNGWLVERFGTRKLYLWCFGSFTVASGLCGVAWSAQSLIGFRVLQGMAGGLLAPMAQLIMAQVAGRQMARVLGYTAVPVLLGPILGPVAAGAILEHLSWRWLFLVNVPIGILALVLAALFLPRAARRGGAPPFDLVGFLFLTPAMVFFLYGADHLGNRSGEALIAVAFILFALFLRHASRRGEKALLNLKLFRGGTFLTSARSQFLLNGISFATQMLLPLYLIRVCGRTPGEVGLLLIPLGVGMMAVFPALGRLTDRFGIRNVAACGSATMLLSTICLVGLARYGVAGSLFVISLLLRGIGQGAIGVPTITAAYSGVPKNDLPMATTTLNIVQRLGGPTLTTVAATFIAWRLRLGQSPHTTSNAFLASFVLLGLLQVFLLASSMRLPKVLPTVVSVEPA